ncbi:hypothetical protein Q0Z83_025860 [Actinoplanes sichuanensis]|uniref:Uncharacterized protein n=1 Tax=Actinoplanes sichuanensis TaxID=512349 RepID=A0ABW4AVL9_9ACTN|nr:hypothetical protein [Actinoplanes sichuanensis]BEL04395.1 hypothetical protein Q0Z83_025860 [Actinoplanes sichuanensis]
MQPAQATKPTNVVIVLDGTTEAQSWVDLLVVQARSGVGGWPHAHPTIPPSQITVSELNSAIGRFFVMDGRPWSVPGDGYPPLDQPGHPVADPGAGDPGNRGTRAHNLLHSLIGNFH